MHEGAKVGTSHIYRDAANNPSQSLKFYNHNQGPFTLQNISRYYAKWVPYAMIIRDGLIIIKIFALASKFHVNLHELTPNQHSVIDYLVGNAGNDCENFAKVRETKP